MKCHVCREKDVELLTRWERIRFWLFVRVNSVLFPQDYGDLKNDRYTQGCSDGNIQGYEQGVRSTQPRPMITADQMFRVIKENETL